MKICLRKFLAGFSCSLLFIAISTIATGQNESDERPLLVSQNGLQFHKDSVFLLNLRFRMQNRFGYFSQLDASDEPGFETVIRRLRLRFDGYVLSPQIAYYIQLSFSRSDQDLISGTVAQTVRDAMIYYYPQRNFYIGFGQSKLPGNRERVVSSGNLQMPDRSIANSVFTLDRDMGVFAYWTIPAGNQLFQWKNTITGGEGRGQTIGNAGLSYTTRLEWLPLGAFENSGDYSEGDLEFETIPKLSVAAGYNYNDRTTRTGGTLGSTLEEPVDLKTFIADLMFKYQGWGLMGEYFNRSVSGYNAASPNIAQLLRIPQGQGFNVQLSRMLARKHEITLRYAGTEPRSGFSDYIYQYRTKALGYSFYLNKHRVKLQYYFGLDSRYHPGTINLLYPYKDRINTMVQVELGI